MIRQQHGTRIEPALITTSANFVAYNTYQDEHGYYLMGIGETNTKPSMTVPDMALPLKTLIERYTRGQNITTFQGAYLGDQEVVPDVLERMSFDERLELAGELKTSIYKHRQKMGSASRPEFTDTPLNQKDDSAHPDESM